MANTHLRGGGFPTADASGQHAMLPRAAWNVSLGGEYFFIFTVKICIFKVKIYICKVKIYIFNLKTKIPYYPMELWIVWKGTLLAFAGSRHCMLIDISP